MGQLNVSIGGRSYPLACRDGEEDRLRKLAAHVDSKATELTGALGQMSEPRLLLMSAILIADQHFDSVEKYSDTSTSDSDAIITQALNNAANRIEAIASALEQHSTDT